MKISRSLWIAIAVLFLWLVLSWLLGGWIGMQGPSLLYLRGGLCILGIIGFAGYLLMRPKTPEGGPAGVSTSEMDDNFNEAAKRLQAAGVKQMTAMPAVFLMGDTDSAKTSVIAKSDITELLSGQAQQEIAIVPTRAVNFWLANRSTIFVDPAGALLNDVENRRRLFKKFSVVALQSIMGSRKLPARSVVFTISCDTLLQKGGADALAVKARQFQAILAEMAQEIGSRFPVYVLFTKADKLSYFRDFVENLSEQEATDIFGVTLPLDTEQGVYAQRQTSRLTEAFHQLYYWLADRRPTYLIREHKPAVLPNIYEFPREFGKLRPLLTTFLVDLCRPAQLGVSPFLRGFYFTGIRAVTVNDVAPAAMQVPEDDRSMDASATRMFTFPAKGTVPLMPARETGARKIAQWVFLTRFIPEVLLADGTATTVGEGNVKLNVARRFAWGAAAALALFMGIWWIISYGNNRALVHGALDAAKGAPIVASLDGLQRLTTVKNTMETLNDFAENGRPFSYGGFLYSGDAARESVTKAYYGLFRRLLLTRTQENLVQVCTSPSDAQTQGYLYDDLKSYLMTTQYHNKSVPEFLTPALLLHWKTGQTVGAEEERLARLNFDFYSRQLLVQNEYWPPTAPDGAAVNNCRDYLNKMSQTEFIYHRVLSDAGGQGKSIVFNRDYPGTEVSVVNAYEVEPAFTKDGFGRFQDLLKNPKKYLNGEAWVLEPKSTDMLDLARLTRELQRLYQDDFIKKWVAYLNASKVRKPASAPDAVAKLDKLTGDRSALLLDICVASENTAAANKDISDAFKSAHSVTPPGCLQTLVSGDGTAYMKSLVTLLGSLKALDTKSPPTYDAARHAAADAEAGVKTMSLNFGPPSDSPVTAMLLAPIYTVGEMADTGAADAAGGACKALSSTLNKYPFNANSSEDATMQEADAFLKKPDGILWKLVADPAIAPLIVQFGDTFSAKSGASKPAKASFINFLTRAANLSHLLYGSSGQAAGFKFTLAPQPSPGVVEHVTLRINGSIQSADARGNNPKEFEWPGNGQGVEQVLVKFAGGSDFNFPKHTGVWGLWHFVDSMALVKDTEFELMAKQGKDPITTPAGAPEAVRFTVDPSKAALLRTRYFALSCVAKPN